jgi:hypothetical protein
VVVAISYKRAPRITVEIVAVAIVAARLEIVNPFRNPDSGSGEMEDCLEIQPKKHRDPAIAFLGR